MKVEQLARCVCVCGDGIERVHVCVCVCVKECGEEREEVAFCIP